jgi:cytochrome c oxidase subunit II
VNMSQFTTAASDYARSIDGLFALVSTVSLLIVTLVSVLIVVFLVRYRRGSAASRGELPEILKHEVEIGWTLATLFLFLFIFWWAGTRELTALTPPKYQLEIHVVAKQWMWRIQHPSGAREIDEIHVPALTPIRLTMTSQDVIHDLYIPALRIKQDVLPDRFTYLWFTATKTGTFHFTCSQYCGTEHSVMAGSMVIVTPQDYARWIAAQPEGDDLAHQGEKLFHTIGCSGCHDSPGATVHAPDLHNLYGHLVQLADGTRVKADEAYLRDKILLPNKNIPAGYAADMPSFRGVVSEGQIVELVAYLKSLSTGLQGEQQ